MTQNTNVLDRRTALKKGGLVVSTLAVGVPAISGTAAAEESGIRQMVVDAPPAISANAKGRVTAAIYPGGDVDPEALLDEVEGADEGRFKFGPDDGPGMDDMSAHADSVDFRLVNNGVHGKVLGVFFDSATADEWWDGPDDDRGAKLSAVKGDANERDDIIAWGADEEVSITPIRLELS